MNILVIQNKMIGDVLTTSLLFELLRDLYPNAKLHYLVDKNTTAVVAGNPFIDMLWMRTKTGDGHYFLDSNKIAQLKALKLDLIIDVYAKLGSASLSAILKPKHSISYRKWYTRFRYKKTIKPLGDTPKDQGLAIINRVLLLENLGHTITHIPKPKIYLNPNEIDQAKQILAEANLDKARPIFMISLLGSERLKTYPLDYMAKLLDQLVQLTNGQLLINYIPDQRPEVDTLLEYCLPQTKERIFDKVYGNSLREFMALTAQCDALIGNEGGAVNIAKALNIPTYAIYAPWILKTAWNSYEQAGINRSIHLQDIHPELYTKHPKKYKNKALQLYKQLTPDYVLADLKLFLSTHQFLLAKP